MAEVVRATSEWHRRMTSENLSQSGHAVNLNNYPIGKEAYLYKPPSMAETITRGRRAKHTDHYIGPGIIMEHIGTRSMVTPAGYCVHSTVVPAIVPKYFCRQPVLGTDPTFKTSGQLAEKC